MKSYITYVAYVGGNTSQPIGLGRTRQSAQRDASRNARSAFPGEPVGAIKVERVEFSENDEAHRWLHGYGWTPRLGTIKKAASRTASKRASRSNGALSPSELAALRAYARKHGRTWKAALRDDWMYATAPAELQGLRNRLGPGWLATYRLPAASTRSNGAAKRRSTTSRSKAARPRKRR